jgi:hypothetical protein
MPVAWHGAEPALAAGARGGSALADEHAALASDRAATARVEATRSVVRLSMAFMASSLQLGVGGSTL